LDVSESDDEDFQAGASGSDVGEEFDEDHHSEGDSEVGEGEAQAIEEESGQLSTTMKREEPSSKKSKQKEDSADAPAKKKAKKDKDPNAPKRGLTSFLYFSKEKRSE
jgi:structure-specific recognition protein 1